MALTQAIAQFRKQLDALPHCVILAAPKVPPEDDLKAKVRDILEGAPDRIYRDGIETIHSAKLDENGDLIGEFSDQIGVRSLKWFKYRISDDGVEYWLMNPDEAAQFSAYQADVLALFVAAKGKKKNCAKSIPCGNGCIARGKKCKKGGSEVSEQTKGKIKAAKAAAGSAGAKTKTNSGGVPPEKMNQVTQGIMLALPAAGQTSAPANKRNGAPLEIQELKAAIYKEFGVSSTKELKASYRFKMATNLQQISLNKPEEWKNVYRNIVGVLPDEVFDSGPKAINGVDITKYAHPWRVFGLDPTSDKYMAPKGLKGKEKKDAQKKAEDLLIEDVKNSYKALAARYHPDVGGDVEVFQKLTQFKNSLTYKF